MERVDSMKATQPRLTSSLEKLMSSEFNCSLLNQGPIISFLSNYTMLYFFALLSLYTMKYTK